MIVWKWFIVINISTNKFHFNVDFNLSIFVEIELSTWKFDMVNGYNFSLILIHNKAVYESPCLLASFGLNVISSKDKPWKGWMIYATANCIENWMLVMRRA